jgi:hypothetical protein
MAYSGNIGAIDVNKTFLKSFNGIEDNSVYQDPFGFYHGVGVKIDIMEEMKSVYKEEMKSLGTATGGDGSTNLTLVPAFFDVNLTDLSRKQTPATVLIPRIATKSTIFQFGQITAKQTAYAGTEGDDLTGGTDNPSITPQVANMKYLYSRGITTGQAKVAVPQFNLSGFEANQTANGNGIAGNFGDRSGAGGIGLNTMTAARALKEFEESLIFNGDSSVDALEFDGIIKTLGATNAIDKSGAGLALADINTSIGLSVEDGGLPNLAFASIGAYIQLINLVADKIGFFQPSFLTEFGFSAISFNTLAGNVSMIASRFLDNTATNSSIYFLDMSVWEMRVLQDMVMEKLDKNADTDAFFMKEYLTLICRAPQFNSSIINIL